MNSLTPEGRFLATHPGLRDRVLMECDFIRWREGLLRFEIDGELFWVRRRVDDDDLGDDRPKDLDQIIVDWTRQFRPDLLPNHSGGEDHGKD